MESQVIEYKSLKKITTGGKGFSELAKTCVCLANSQGGIIIIGYDDKKQAPPQNQRITQSQINDALERLRGLTFSVGLAPSDILTHENGGEYFKVKVFPSQKIVATTSDGKIFIRIADRCEPIQGEDLQRIVAEKDAFQWELVEKNYTYEELPLEDINNFIDLIRNSDRVKESVKLKSNIEILEHYNFIHNKKVTNLGVLWLGAPEQRARLSYPITVQYIVYDELKNKTRKYVWDDYEFNPMQLLKDIERESVELSYSYEFPDGLFRNKIRHYPQAVIRELLINAFAHKSYLISADIIIEVYPGYMQITSPGSLPLGITKDNILHSTHRRNPHLIKVFHDLKLMEGEGSGFDLIYEKLSTDGKLFPEIINEYDKVVVGINSKITNIEALRLTDYIDKHFALSQREKIVVGIIARHQKILSTELSKLLQLKEEDRLRSWVSNLVEKKIIIKRGQGKGNNFLINPKLLSDSKLNIKPTLRTIEPHVLRQLIIKDLEIYPKANISEISERFEKVQKKDIQKLIYNLAEEGVLVKHGSKTDRRYSLAEKKRK
jgi:ATP-dependent DNA helicase RecG